MKSTIEELIVAIGADDSGLSSVFDNVKSESNKLDKTIDSLSKSINVSMSSASKSVEQLESSFRPITTLVKGVDTGLVATAKGISAAFKTSISGVGAAISGIKWFAGATRTAFIDARDALSSFAKSTSNSIRSFISSVKDVGGIVPYTGNLIKSGFNSAKDTIVSFGNQTGQAIQSTIKSVQDAGKSVLDFGGRVALGMKSAAISVKNAAVSVADFGRTAGLSVASAYNAIRSLTIADVWNGIKTGANSTGTAFKSMGVSVASNSVSIAKSIKSAFIGLKDNGIPAFKAQVASGMGGAKASIIKFGGAVREQSYMIAANLDKGINTAMRATKKAIHDGIAALPSLFSSAGSAATSFASRVASSMKRSEGNVKQFGAGILDLTTKLGLGIFAIKEIAGAAVDMGVSMLKPGMQMEGLQIGFTSLFKSASKAKSFLAELANFAAATPFEMPEVAEAAQKLLAMETPAKDIIPILTDIGDAMAGLGRSAADVSDVVTVFGQMRMEGKVTADNMNQLTDRGINAWGFLAKAMGKTIPEVRKLSEQGLIPADMAIQAIRKSMHDVFGGGMAAKSKSLKGIWSTIKDNVNKAWLAFSGSGFNKAKEAITTIGDFVSGQGFQDFSKNAGDAMGRAFDSIGKFFSSVDPKALESLKTSFSELSSTISNVLAPVLGPVSAAISSIFSSKASDNASVLTESIKGLSTVISSVNTAIQFMQNIWNSVWPFLQQVGAFIGETFNPVWQELVNVWQTQLQPAFNELWAALQPAMPFFQLLGGIIVGIVITALILLVSVLAGVAKGVAGLLSGLAIVFGGIVQIISGAITVVLGIIGFFVHLFTGQFDKLGSDLGRIWGGIVTMFTGVWNVIRGIFTAAVGLIWGIISGFATTVIRIFTGLYNTLVGHSIIPDLVNGIIKWFAMLPARVMSFLTGLVTSAINAIKNLYNMSVAFVQTMVSSIITYFSGLVTQGNAKFNDLKNKIVSILSGIVNSARSKASDIVNGFVGTLASLPSRISNILNDMTNRILGWRPPALPAISLPGFPGHAAGISNNPIGHMAWVGEHGKELMYIPPGASIFSNRQSSAMMSPQTAATIGNTGPEGRNGTNIFILEIDGRELGRIVGEANAKETRLKFGTQGWI
jgi:tape measure domain-containing protein